MKSFDTINKRHFHNKRQAIVKMKEVKKTDAKYETAISDLKIHVKYTQELINWIYLTPLVKINFPEFQNPQKLVDTLKNFI